MSKKYLFKKQLTNEQDLEIYLSVEGLLGREKTTRAAMGRKFNVSASVAESGYKRGKKLYDSGERDEGTEIVEHNNQVTAHVGDNLVGIDKLLTGSEFHIPGKPEGDNHFFYMKSDTENHVWVYKKYETSDDRQIKATSILIPEEGVELVGEDESMAQLATLYARIYNYVEEKGELTLELHPMVFSKGKAGLESEEPITFSKADAKMFHTHNKVRVSMQQDLVQLSTVYIKAPNYTNELKAALSKYEITLDDAKPSAEEVKAVKEKKIHDTVLGEVSELPVIVNTSMAVIVHNGESHQIPSSHHNFGKVCQAIKDRQWMEAIELMHVEEQLKEWTQGRIQVIDGQITFEGEPIEHQGFTKRIIAMMEDRDENNLTKLVAFLDKVMDNPSNKVVSRIFDFMKYNDITITEDGDLLVFKAVTSTYKDCHTKTIDNSVGAVVKMRRNLVDEDNKNLCSKGLHVCSLSYLPHYAGTNGVGNRIVMCKLNPTNIVSITDDYNQAKIRCCKYLVLKDVTADYRSGKLKIDKDGLFQ